MSLTPTHVSRKKTLCCPATLTTAIVASTLAFGVTLPFLDAEAAADDRATTASTAGTDESRSLLRSRRGLLALYDFASPSGELVKDRSGVGNPVDLRIVNPESVHRSEGSLEVRDETVIRSDKPANRITQAIRQSGEITIEAWIRPAGTSQNGPARIVTLSKDSGERNFTLGQEGDRFDVRLRTTETNNNGIASFGSEPRSLAAQRTHVVYTRDRTGRTRIYLDGKPAAMGMVGGETSKWQRSYCLALANELNEGRPWLGTYYLVAIYNRDLLPREVERNFRAGTDPQAMSKLLARREAETGEGLFETQIAPLLSNHCLECHDANSREGRLDLSRKQPALAGGQSGPAIVPGKAWESLLWEYVELDEMPQDRPPLSPEQKTLLKQWIDAGAVWSFETIDPAVYAHNDRAGKNWVRRLTVPEYVETVRSTVGVDIAADARRILPPDLRADGFSNTAYNLNIDLKHVEAYARLAEMIVQRMDVETFAAQYTKSRLLTDDNMRPLIAHLGRWLLRGPLDEHELAVYRGISTTVASAGGDFEEAVRFVLEAMLQSPRFLYRIENQRGDGTAWPVDDYELASRLSYLLWGGPPDKALMRAAEAGELDRDGVEKQVRRMLQDPRAIERSRQFLTEWLDLDRLDHLQPNSEKFPHWDPVLAADMRDETLAFFEDVVWNQNRPLSDLLNAQLTYATPRLAKHYRLGLKPQGEGRSRYDLSAVPGRGGLLTHGSVLTVGGDEASMVSRGLFVLHELLRGTVNDPPPCVDTTPVPTKAGLTQRGIAEARVANVACGGCHAKFEPLAYGLEKFDGLGSYHEKDEHGNPLRDDGKILFPGREEPVSYQSSAELMNLLAESQRVRESITWKVTQFALGRPLVAADAPMLAEIHKSATEGGGTYPGLMTAIALSDLVQMVRTEADP